jgi:ketosteroid isomerase-like protein
MEEEMTLEMTRTDDEARIRGLLDEWTNAVRVKDIDAIMARYAPEVVAFDAIARLQFRGAQAYREHWQACLARCSGPMIFEVHDLSIAAAGDVAFSHFLVRCGGTGDDGQEQSGWTRGTVGWRKTSGSWKVVHEHFSAPFDMASGKALLELES